MTDHLMDCGLFLFRYLRQLQVEAAYEGEFPLKVGRANRRLAIEQTIEMSQLD